MRLLGDGQTELRARGGRRPEILTFAARARARCPTTPLRTPPAPPRRRGLAPPLRGAANTYVQNDVAWLPPYSSDSQAIRGWAANSLSCRTGRAPRRAPPPLLGRTSSHHQFARCRTGPGQFGGSSAAAAATNFAALTSSAPARRRDGGQPCEAAVPEVLNASDADARRQQPRRAPSTSTPWPQACFQV